MLRKIIKSKTFKVVSVFTAYSMILQIMAPAAWALTSGPTQPEAGSFQQADVSQMVDLFSGDFNYNLPLVTVPGPNGGYPINLTYNSNITMEQEASWVGLGWNVNTGAINRTMRGLPDDYSGNDVKKTNWTKPARNISFYVGANNGNASGLAKTIMEKAKDKGNTEVLGFDLSKVTYGAGRMIYWDSYAGLGSKVTTNAGIQGDFFGLPMNLGLGIDFDAKNGLGVSPKIGVNNQEDKVDYSVGLNVNSKQGLQDMYLSASYGNMRDEKTGELSKSRSGVEAYSRASSSVSFAGSSYVPATTVPKKGVSFEVEFKNGVSILGTAFDLRNKGIYSQSRIDKEDTLITRSGYGYIHSADNPGSGDELMDFNREKDGPVNKHAKALPVPITAHDLFTIKGQGTGGSFRAYRSDVPVFHDPSVESVSKGYNIGIDADPPAGNPPPEIKFGVNPGLSRTTAYSGMWQTNEVNSKNKAEAITNKYGFDLQTSNSTHEAVYFKTTGELTSDNYTTEAPYSEQAARVEIAKFFEPGGLSFNAKARPYVKMKDGTTKKLNDADRTDRHVRTQHISFLTRAQLSNMGKVVKDETGTTIEEYGDTLSNHGDHNVQSQIGEFTVINADGTVYKYGLPAYNLYHREVSFAVDEATTASSIQDKLVSYTSGVDDAVKNGNGNDHFYSKTELAPYAHSFLLTELHGSDYADIDDTIGVSDGDVGYWVKFNYERKYDTASTYKWRIPYEAGKANLITANQSDPRDNRASYTYGEKEVIYVESVETKTHIARFYTSTRDDGAGVLNSNGGYNSANKLERLDSIKLFNKNDNSYAIKTIHFEYETTVANQLCGKVPNNAVTNGGKLTLKKVWFTYGDNDRGSLSPYEFTYHAYNEDYDNLKQDRWGQFQDDDPTNSPYLSNLDNPYVNQKNNEVDNGLRQTQRDSIASSWRLIKIALPSGGDINIEYEMDDYGYVQNKRAMQMCRIVDTGKEVAAAEGNGKISPTHTRIYFELEKPIANDANANDELKKYIEGLDGEDDRIYFKTYTKLKETPDGYGDNPTEASNDGYAYDYVEGYCQLDVDLDAETGYGFSTDGDHKASTDYKWAYVQVKKEHVKDKDPATNKIHPFQKAALQYLRLNRADLFQSPNTQAGNVATAKHIVRPILATAKLLSEVRRLFNGWYNYAINNGYAEEILIGGSDFFKPSFIRLNSPDYIKYGGGSRVSKITINDGWNTISGLSDATNYDYGQEYTYRLEDGKSSGVAEYEPLVGGEENPFREPIRFSSDRFLVKDKALYVEKPYNESLFPSANVGYSRVVVKNLERTDDNSQPVTKDTQGYQVHEFYTAKEFPVQAHATGVEHRPFRLMIPIPFIGGVQINNNGYSQGYYIELNDMHGKKKAQSTYAYGADVNDMPAAKTEYIYKTVKTYNPNAVNKVSSIANVFTGDGQESTETLGRTVDFGVDLRENKTVSKLLGFNMNVTTSGFIPIPTGLPNADYSESTFRSVVTNKVVHKCGILDKIRTTKEGAVIVAENLHYDPKTGQPVLTSLTNNFEAPVYSYNFPSHWYYDGMQGAYQTQGMNLTDSASIKTYCEPGALLQKTSTGDLFWLEQVSPSMKLLNASNAKVTVTSGTTYKVIRSGHRNQQGIAVGNIESLSNPATGRYYPLFANPHHTNEGFNAFTFYDFNDATNNNADPFNYIACNGDTLEINNVSFDNIGSDASADVVYLWTGFGGPDECYTALTFSDGALINQAVVGNGPVHIDSMNFTLLPSGQVYAYDGNSNATGTVSFLEGCEQRSCLDNVLNAFANKMTDQWDLNYTDVDAFISDATADLNDYRYGQYGIWRLQETHQYKVRRKQKSGTRISDDGTFKHFTIFDWAGNPNPDWTMRNTVRKYSPYGFELENANAIHTKSAALYGYENSLVTAVGNNTPYFELAFDGFEDYGSTYISSSGHGHGHLKFTATSTPTLSSSEAHTGEYSLNVANGTNVSFSGAAPYFQANSGDDYYFSCWVKIPDGGGADVDINNGSGTTTFSTSSSDEVLDGWRRLEGKFTGGGSLTITLKSTVASTTVNFDDIRIQPFVSTMKSFVYDANTHWLKAELDDRNYATFYNYDEQGHLIQVKKETSNGVVTMRMDRMMVRQP